jgi:hypothetical protein
VLALSEFNREGLEFSPVFLGLSNKLRDMGSRRSVTAPLDHGFDVFFFSLEDCSHRSVCKIPNPAVDAIFSSFLLGVIPEINPLNNPFDNQLDSRFSHGILPGILLQHF